MPDHFCIVSDHANLIVHAHAFPILAPLGCWLYEQGYAGVHVCSCDIILCIVQLCSHFCLQCFCCGRRNLEYFDSRHYECVIGCDTDLAPGGGGGGGGGGGELVVKVPRDMCDMGGRSGVCVWL